MTIKLVLPSFAGYIVEIYECQKQFDSVTQVVGNYSSIPRSLTDIPRPAVIPCGDPQPPPWYVGIIMFAD